MKNVIRHEKGSLSRVNQPVICKVHGFRVSLNWSRGRPFILWFWAFPPPGKFWLGNITNCGHQRTLVTQGLEGGGYCSLYTSRLVIEVHSWIVWSPWEDENPVLINLLSVGFSMSSMSAWGFDLSSTSCWGPHPASAICSLLLTTCYLLLISCYLLLATCYFCLLLANWFLLIDFCYLLLATTCYLLVTTCK